MSYNKAKVTSFSKVLYANSLKFIAHRTSMFGEYGYRIGEMQSIVLNLRDFALNVNQSSGKLKEESVVKIVQFNIESKHVQADCRDIIESKRFKLMAKYYTSALSLYAAIELHKSDWQSLIESFVHDLYDDTVSNYECSYAYFEAMRKMFSK